MHRRLGRAARIENLEREGLLDRHEEPASIETLKTNARARATARRSRADETRMRLEDDRWKARRRTLDERTREGVTRTTWYIAALRSCNDARRSAGATSTARSREALARQRRRSSGLSEPPIHFMRVVPQDVTISIGEISLVGTLTMPAAATGVVMFAHGSGSSRRSPRNRHVATALNARGLATLLFDLLTVDEERFDAIDASLRFDIGLLAERLVGATDSLVASGRAGDLPIGYFGASTGAAAALIAAARRPLQIAAVVSRGGRPDLARESLAAVRAPTLLVVGGADMQVLQLNREAAMRMTAPHEIEVVRGATHLFEEPGALDAVARLAGSWFVEHFAAAEARASLPST
jgi:predicted alpha/beta-hydrolase family hydrolase